MKNEEMLSLYEYLGHAAGSELGKKVALEATNKNIQFASHKVANARYQGTILKYPKEFLDAY